MVQISEEVQAVINEMPGYVATASKDDGMPNVSVKGSIAALDDHTLAFASVDSGKTLANLADNKNIAVTIAIPAEHKSYQFKGTAEIVESGPLFDKMEAGIKKIMPDLSIKNVVKIDVTEVHGL